MRHLREYLFDLSNVAGSISLGFQAFVAKMPGFAGNLTLILHVAKKPLAAVNNQIDDDTVLAVERIVKEFLLPHAEVFYESDKGAGIERIRTIGSFVLTNEKTVFTPSDFTRNVAPLKGVEMFDLKKAVSPLVAGGWFDLSEKAPNAPRWTLNPRVRKQLGD
jgi:hypothetical protein